MTPSHVSVGVPRSEVPLGVHMSPLPHGLDGSFSLSERLFGGPTDAPASAAEVLGNVHLAATDLLDDLARRCTAWSESLIDEASEGVQADTQALAEMLRQAARSLPLPSDPFRVVLLGRTQAGKSTLFSYLTGSDVSPVGDGGQRTTRSVVAGSMAGCSGVEVVDTPGVGALDGDEDREIALDAARRADLVVWVATNNSQPSETAAALSQVARWGAPMLLVFNCREDLLGEGAVDYFLAYPESTFADLEGHLARLAPFLDPHGQRPLQVLAIHAAAALIGGRSNPTHVDLLRESRVDTLAAAIRAEADQHRHQRRAAAIVDTARRALVDAAEWLAREGDRLALLVETRREEGADFDRRAARLLADGDLQARTEIEGLFRRFDDWADRHYLRTDTDLQLEWDADERRLREDADELLRTTDARLRRRLRRLDDEVTAAWSKRLEANLTKHNQISANRLAPRWLEAAGKTAAGLAGTLIGMAIGGLVANAPGAAVGGLIGGFVGDGIGSFFRPRRTQLARRRGALHESVRDALEAVKRDVDAGWVQCKESIEQDLAGHASDRDQAIGRAAAMAHHASVLGESALEAVAAADSHLVRALLHLEGRDRLADHVGTVSRRPGFACLVPLPDSSALREFMLRPPSQTLEQIRPTPCDEAATVYRRAAYALDVGRRHVVLVPDGDAIRADIPEQLSPELLAAEAALVSAVVDVPLDLRSTPTQLSEAAP